jgi:hypothetical protein
LFARQKSPAFAKASAGQGGQQQKSEVRDQTSGVKLISDLRLLTSIIEDFYSFNDLNDFNGF